MGQNCDYHQEEGTSAKVMGREAKYNGNVALAVHCRVSMSRQGTRLGEVDLKNKNL